MITVRVLKVHIDRAVKVSVTGYNLAGETDAEVCAQMHEFIDIMHKVGYIDEPDPETGELYLVKP